MLPTQNSESPFFKILNIQRRMLRKGVEKTIEFYIKNKYEELLKMKFTIKTV